MALLMEVVMVKSNNNSELNEEYYCNILDSSNIGTWMWNPKTGEVEINENWASIIGYTKEELEPISINVWNQYGHPEDLIKSEEVLRKVFAGELTTYVCDCRMRHKLGHWVWIRDTGKVVEEDEKGSPIKMIGTHVDISELKKVQEELAKSNNELSIAIKKAEDTANSIKRFYSTLSHELKSPINSIIGYSYMLKNVNFGTTNLNTIIDSIVFSSEQLSRLIEDIVEVSRIEAGIVNIKLEPMNLQDLIYDIRLSHSDRFKEKGLQFLTYQGLEYDGMIISDSYRIRQIVENLLNNALKNTASGEVALEITNHVEPDGGISVEIIVSDTGVGIEASKLEHIFDPYYQVEGDNINDGLGLGLYVSKELAKALQGKIVVESELGLGSKFTLSFKSDSAESSELKKSIGTNGNNQIIYLSKSTEIKYTIDEILLNSGYDIKKIHNFTSIFSSENINFGGIIIINYDRIRVEDVIGISRILSYTNRPKNIILLFNTIDEYPKNLLAEIGIINLVTKPFHPNELIRTISSVKKNLTEESQINPTKIEKDLLLELSIEIENGDVEKIEYIIKKIYKEDTRAGEFLQKLLEKYDYKRMRTWLLKYR